ncbi:putative GTPase [Gregarina niphandrodes]|uniref:GTPase n=1 Tax=Gregarina niphandrodes TaxID=110365 RepID=A0A023BA06_GRENI|nr:putative GTPase [Gregarina niphandrodes]EZG77292.1 putative GTPase [Gregarina niphandrodes]|eukprot:XP_011129518.1 putative GTPase [Gregarina niphandrodes]
MMMITMVMIAMTMAAMTIAARMTSREPAVKMVVKMVVKTEPVCLRSNNKDEKENELGHEEIIAALQKCEDIRVIYSAFYHYFAKVVNFGPLLCASDLQREELRSFTEWRRGLSECELEEKVVIAPYEKNLEYWKQLWRTIERSDIVLEIVDSRNPLIYRSGALEKLIESYDKKVILCLNKADYLKFWILITSITVLSES